MYRGWKLQVPFLLLFDKMIRQGTRCFCVCSSFKGVFPKGHCCHHWVPFLFCLLHQMCAPVCQPCKASALRSGSFASSPPHHPSRFCWSRYALSGTRVGFAQVHLAMCSTADAHSGSCHIFTCNSCKALVCSDLFKSVASGDNPCLKGDTFAMPQGHLACATPLKCASACPFTALSVTSTVWQYPQSQPCWLCKAKRNKKQAKLIIITKTAEVNECTQGAVLWREKILFLRSSYSK